MTVHRVYWTEEDSHHNGQTCSRDFDSEHMTDSLKFCEKLRRHRKDGKAISHVCLSSEIVECTSLPGVDVTGPDYNWKKRRI